MRKDQEFANERKMTNVFERYLTVWVALCIIGGIILGKIAPELARSLMPWPFMWRRRR